MVKILLGKKEQFQTLFVCSPFQFSNIIMQLQNNKLIIILHNSSMRLWNQIECKPPYFRHNENRTFSSPLRKLVYDASSVPTTTLTSRGFPILVQINLLLSIFFIPFHLSSMAIYWTYETLKYRGE